MSAQTNDNSPHNTSTGVFYDEDLKPIAIYRQGVMSDLRPLSISERWKKVARFKAERGRVRQSELGKILANQGGNMSIDDYLNMSRGR